MPVRMRLRDRLLQFRRRRCLLQQVLSQREPEKVLVIALRLKPAIASNIPRLYMLLF